MTDLELTAIPFIVDMLNSASKDKPIKNRIIANGLLNPCKHWFEPPRVRKMINYISLRQMTCAPLVANNKGYYITDDQVEILRYVQSLWERIASIEARRKSVSKWGRKAAI